MNKRTVTNLAPDALERFYGKLILTPYIYRLAKANGYEMSNYIKAQKIPKATK